LTEQRVKIVVITLFPELIELAVRFGVLGRAIERGLLAVETRNPRDFVDDPHRTVDDRPYGGGPGMVLKAEPLRRAMVSACEAAPGARRVYLAADGVPVTQAKVAGFAALDALVLVAGRYEGVDERFVATQIDESLAVGDFVMSGGELPALAVIDAIARLRPGALGDAESAVQESFATGLLDWPHYTRPEVWNGLAVPDVLLGGNHAAIEQWRRGQALDRTRERRPDLLTGRRLDEVERRVPVECTARQDAAPQDAGTDRKRDR
jgi:tRNA (guanine37-N1)-methyltransferase